MQQRARQKLDILKLETIPKVLPEENIIKYDINWTENGVDNNVHSEYLEKLSKDVRRALENQVKNGVYRNVSSLFKDRVC